MICIDDVHQLQSHLVSSVVSYHDHDEALGWYLVLLHYSMVVPVLLPYKYKYVVEIEVENCLHVVRDNYLYLYNRVMLPWP